MKNKDIDRQKDRLFKMYLKNIITYKELIFYLNKLDEPLLKEPDMPEPPTIY